MSYAPFIKEIGRGPKGSKPLTAEQAESLFGDMMDGRVLESGYAFVGDAKYFKEVDEKGFGFGVFVFGIRPVFGECERAGFDFVPREWFLHGIERLELG